VGQTGQSRRGFTLTEILMAVGILGIGLTMVASVFPVAVDQTRRSRETTMAALCARNVAATIRAKRDTIVYSHTTTGQPSGIRGTTLIGNSSGTGKVPLTRPVDGLLTPDRIYNPDAFLYEWNRTYSTPDASYNWMEGNYYPVVLATPINPQSLPSGVGPWRITIVVYKLHGSLPTQASSTAANYLGSWANTAQASHGMSGSYVIDWRPSDTTNTRGDAYLVDNVAIATTGAAINWASGSIYLAAVPSAVSGTNVTMSTGAGLGIPITGSNATPTSGLPGWVEMPQAVGAFHTIIGD
jgi:prepilin-type N-terminal cleavage/methylation domain-containing protein